MSSYLDNAGLTNVLVKIKSLLAQKASITAIPTKVSSLENDSGYQTESDVTSKIPTKVSELSNDSGYLTNASLSVPTKVSELENDNGYQTSSEVQDLVKTSSKIFNTNYNLVEDDDYVYDIDYADYSFLNGHKVRKGSFTPKVKSIISTLQTDGTIPTSDSVASQIATALEGITELEFTVVDSLPATPTKGTVYLVPKGTYDTNSVTINQTDDSGNAVTDVVQDSYDEYIWVSESTTDGVTTYNYEKIGSTDVDLSQYAKTADLPTKTSDLTNDSDYQTSSEVKALVKTSSTFASTKYSHVEDDDYIYNIEYYDYSFLNGYKILKGSFSSKVKSIISTLQTNGTIPTSDSIESQIATALPSVTDSAVDGKYVSSVSQENGKITVTRATLPSGGGSSDEPITNDTIDAIFTEVFG